MNYGESRLTNDLLRKRGGDVSHTSSNFVEDKERLHRLRLTMRLATAMEFGGEAVELAVTFTPTAARNCFGGLSTD